MPPVETQTSAAADQHVAIGGGLGAVIGGLIGALWSWLS
jgi:uncharacterized protein YcfJ